MQAGTTLIHGGSGGVGTAAIQLTAAAGAQALVTAGSDSRCARCRELGAARAFNHRSEDFVAACLEATDSRGVDVVLDCIGGGYLDRNLQVLATDGRLVVIGLMGGRTAELDFGRVLIRRLQIIGSTLRALSPSRKGRILAGLYERFGDDLSGGLIRPVLDRTLPFSRVVEAHRLLETGEIFGKIVLTPDPATFP